MNDTVDVPAGVYVECPLAKKKLRPVSACAGCEHYAGLLDRFPGAQHLPFAQRYMAACRYPFGRALFEVDTDAGP